MGVCTAFVFAALVEFTFVNYLWRKTAASSYLDNENERHYSNSAADEYGIENGGKRRSNDVVQLNMVIILEIQFDDF